MTAKAQRPSPLPIAEREGRENDPASRSAAEHARDGVGVPLSEVIAWVESWDSDEELPEPKPRKLF